jgi:outer membrane protein assembly factor BamD
MSLILRNIFLGMLAILLLGACSTVKQFFVEDKDKSPEQLMQDGLNYMDRGLYEDAFKAFQDIRDRYPYSKYAITAELKIADALFKRGSYDEAYEAYDDFEKLHPKNKDIPYVIYQKGMCNFEQITTIDREQVHTLKAKEIFERLIKQYPRSEYATRGRKVLMKCIIYLAEYELYVGNFYYKMGFYRAALGRYNYLLHNYPDLGQYHEAIEKISVIKKKLAEEEGELIDSPL